MITEIKNFRNKYPEYNDLDDMTLATKLAMKYPEYSDLPEKVRGMTMGEVIATRPEYAQEKGAALSTAPPKWVEPIGNAAQMTGLFGGAAIGGTAAGPPGAVIGGGLGYAGMGQLYHKALEFTGIAKPRGLKQTAIETGRDVLTGGAMEAGGQIGGVVIPKVAEKIISSQRIPMAAKATTPEMKGIVDLARRENVSILAPDVTGNRAQALLFNAADKAIGGSGVTQKAAAKTVIDMNAYANRVLGRLGGEFDPTVLGGVAKEGMARQFAPIKQFGDHLYEIAAKESIGTPTTLKETTDLINNIRGEKEFLYLSGEIKTTLNKVINDISPMVKTTVKERYGGLPTDILAKLQKQGIEPSKTLDFSEVEQIRRAVSKISDYAEISGNPGHRYSAKILDAIDKDMTKAADKAGTLAKEALEDARKFQKQNIFGLFKGKTEIGKPSVGTRIQKLQNEDFLKIISKGNITELQDIKKVLPSETMQYVKRSWLTDLFSRHQRILQTAEGKHYMIDTPGVGAELNKFGDKYLKTLFNPQEIKMLDEFRKLSQNIGFAEKIAGNPSGTAQTIYTIQLITGAGLAGYGTWKRDPISASTGLIFTFGGPYAIARFMTSPAGFKYMTTGAKISPIMKEIVSASIKSAAMAGSQSSIEMNRKSQEQPIEGQP